MDSIQAKFDSIVKSDVNKILSEGFAQIYRQKPNFPVTYLAEWLKKYSSSQKTKSNLINLKKIKTEKYDNLQKLKAQQIQTKQHKAKQVISKIQNQNQHYKQMLEKTAHLQDLLTQQLPQFIQKSYNLTGAYIGKLDYSKKPLQQHNFQIGSQNNLQNPKIISYIGACKSHAQLMINKILPNGQGRSYQIFEQSQQNQQNNEEGKPLEQNSIKKKYIYVDNVQKQKKIYYFKYPKLGAYACFPLKLKSYLNISTLQKGILDYKAYLKTKQQIQKQYNDKLNQAKTEADQATKKFQDFEGSEEDPVFQEQKKNLGQDAEAAEQKLRQLQNNPPVIEQTVFNTVQKLYFLGCDTLGQDRQIIAQNLDNIQLKLDFFVSQWEKKQKKMLLDDILTFLEEQPTFDPLQLQLQEFQKNIVSTYESQIKQQYSQKKQKQGQFQFSIIKAQKNRQLLKDPGFKNSMEVYLNYKIPKYTQIIQIWCMLLGLDKKQINIPSTNRLDYRKIINKQFFDKLFDKLEKYELRRDSSQSVSSEYKINKLLQRLEKVQLEALAKYNSFLLLLHSILKIYCWTRILCRDARKETYQTKLKLKQEKDAQLIKWNEQIQKKLETAKTQLDEQGQQNFQQEQWRKNYQTQNPRPQVLQTPVYLEHLDIQ